MITLKETKTQIGQEPGEWRLRLMDFVDDFRLRRDVLAVEESFELSDERTDALLASTAEALCDEAKITPPKWLYAVPPCGDPYFLIESEDFMAISIVESPLRFRMRKIFVLENFLSRV